MNIKAVLAYSAYFQVVNLIMGQRKISTSIYIPHIILPPKQ